MTEPATSAGSDSTWGDDTAAWDRLVASPVACLATITETGRVDLVPFVFAGFGTNRLLSAVDHKPKRTTRLKRLDNIVVNPAVTILADHYNDDWTQLWWVRAHGHAVVHESPAAVEGALTALTSKYAQYSDQPPTGPLIEITVQSLRSWSASP